MGKAVTADRQLTARQEQALRQLADLQRLFVRREVGAAWVVVSVCTTLEDAVSRELEELVGVRSTLSESKLEKHLVGDFKKELNKSWYSRRRALGRAFDVCMDAPDERRLDHLIELRNAIAHGGLSFTARQMDDYKAFLVLRQGLEDDFGVHVSGVHFQLTEATGRNALRVARAAVHGLLGAGID